MKRSIELKRLSMEHHQALVVAKKVRQAADLAGGQVVQAWNKIQDEYKNEMELHFQKEEKFLLPALNAAGLETHVERILYEHKKLRDILEHDQLPAEKLREFAELLKEHVRFEEKELFSAAEDLLSAETLKKIQHKLEAA